MKLTTDEPTFIRVTPFAFKQLAAVRKRASAKMGRKVTWTQLVDALIKTSDLKETYNALVNS